MTVLVVLILAVETLVSKWSLLLFSPQYQFYDCVVYSVCIT